MHIYSDLVKAAYTHDFQGYIVYYRYLKKVLISDTWLSKNDFVNMIKEGKLPPAFVLRGHLINLCVIYPHFVHQQKPWGYYIGFGTIMCLLQRQRSNPEGNG